MVGLDGDSNRKEFGEILKPFWDPLGDTFPTSLQTCSTSFFGVTLGSLGCVLDDILVGFMTAALNDFLVTFDVSSDVDVHKKWLGGAENGKY